MDDMEMDAELDRNGEQIRRNAEGEAGYLGFEDSAERDGRKPSLDSSIAFALRSPDLIEEQRLAHGYLQEAGLLGESTTIRIIPRIAGQLALKLEGLEEEEPLDQAENLSPDNQSVIKALGDGLKIVGVTVRPTDDGADIDI